MSGLIKLKALRIGEELKEIGLDKETTFNFFIPKPAIRLTLYYVNDIMPQNDSVILSTIDKTTIQPIKFATLTPTVNFFYGPFGEKDELVIMIGDQKNELIQCNNQIKTALNNANLLYQKQNHQNLYDQIKSDQHDYIPHIGLGRIRTNSIKSLLQDPSKYTNILLSIQTKIKLLVESLTKNMLDQNNNILTINKIGILDLDKKFYIKEYSL